LSSPAADGIQIPSHSLQDIVAAMVYRMRHSTVFWHNLCRSSHFFLPVIPVGYLWSSCWGHRWNQFILAYLSTTSSYCWTRISANFGYALNLLHILLLYMFQPPWTWTSQSCQSPPFIDSKANPAFKSNRKVAWCPEPLSWVDLGLETCHRHVLAVPMWGFCRLGCTRKRLPVTSRAAVMPLPERILWVLKPPARQPVLEASMKSMNSKAIRSGLQLLWAKMPKWWTNGGLPVLPVCVVHGFHSISATSGYHGLRPERPDWPRANPAASECSKSSNSSFESSSPWTWQGAGFISWVEQSPRT
jgi:hypothetical protein